MEKQVFPPLVPIIPLTPVAEPAPSRGAFASLTDNGLASTIKEAYYSFQDRRALLGLSNPGTVDGVSREVQRDVLLNNFMFSGLRADLTRAHSAAPLFHTAHNFTMGAQGMPPYSFAALFGSPKVCL